MPPTPPLRRWLAERFYDVGIAEPHALTFAAGLAAGGKKPYVAIYSTFLQRGYDQILHDIALQGLPVRILVDRAGLAVHDGATHHGIYDVSFLSGVSGLRILTPATEEDLRRAMRFSLGYGGPIVIRYPNAEEDARLSRVLCSRVGDPPLLRASFAAGSAPACVIVTYSGLAGRALDACKLLGARGVPCGIVLLGQLAPYAETAEALLPYLKGAGRILFAEEGVRAGGAGMMICDALSRRDPALAARVDIAAIEDGAASPSSPSDLYEFFGLSAGRLADRLSPRNPAAGRENGGTEFSE